MFKREIETVLYNAVTSFPITVLTGPRQSGKTTLLKKLFPGYYYINLEYPDMLEFIQHDPRAFIFANVDKVIIIDEAQRYPEIFSYLQGVVDEGGRRGTFILSASQNFSLLQNVSQSLAGRAAIIELLPLTYQEFLTHPEVSANIALWDWLYSGTYPRPYQEKLDIKLWYHSYIRTYLERDLRYVLDVKNLSDFQKFIKLCAGRHGQLLNLSQLAVDAGISHSTARQWINVLESSYIIFLLQPYHKNYSKRSIKSPKLYFYDSAIVCQLLGIDSSEHLSVHSFRGAIFEGYIISEILKKLRNAGSFSGVYFWRDAHGLEVDCIVENGNTLEAYEIKSTMTFRTELLREINKWAEISNTPVSSCKLIYAGEQALLAGKNKILSWREI